MWGVAKNPAQVSPRSEIGTADGEGALLCQGVKRLQVQGGFLVVARSFAYELGAVQVGSKYGAGLVPDWICWHRVALAGLWIRLMLRRPLEEQREEILRLELMAMRPHRRTYLPYGCVACTQCGAWIAGSQNKSVATSLRLGVGAGCAVLRKDTKALWRRVLT